MNWLSLFRKKSKPRHRTTKRNRRSSVKNRENLKSAIDDLTQQIRTVNIAINRHDEQLSLYAQLIDDNSKLLKRLEDRFNTNNIYLPTDRVSTHRPMTNSLLPDLPVKPQPRQFDINQFSEQEKKILSVFFENHQMALSYADIGKALNKSPHTIKNQMRQINIKADLFNKTVDRGKRNRFRLKDGLHIKKYLNIN